MKPGVTLAQGRRRDRRHRRADLAGVLRVRRRRPAVRHRWPPCGRRAARSGPFSSRSSAVSRLLLLITCVNVAGLLAARAASRRQRDRARGSRSEPAAGGSSAQCLVEGLVLAALGGAAGLLVARGTARVALVARARRACARIASGDHRPDGCSRSRRDRAPVGSCSSRSRRSPRSFGRPRSPGLKRGGTAHAVRPRTRVALVVVQIALGVVLVVGAGLIARTFPEAARRRPGIPVGSHVSPSGSRCRRRGTTRPRRSTRSAAASRTRSPRSARRHDGGGGEPSSLRPHPQLGRPVPRRSRARTRPRRRWPTIAPSRPDSSRWSARASSPAATSHESDDREEPAGRDRGRAPRASRVAGRERHRQAPRASIRNLPGHPTGLGDRRRRRAAHAPASLLDGGPRADLLPAAPDPAQPRRLRRASDGRSRARSPPDPADCSARLDPELPISEVRPLDDYVAGARGAQRFTMILAAAFAAAALLLAPRSGSTASSRTRSRSAAGSSACASRSARCRSRCARSSCGRVRASRRRASRSGFRRRFSWRGSCGRSSSGSARAIR